MHSVTTGVSIEQVQLRCMGQRSGVSVTRGALLNNSSLSHNAEGRGEKRRRDETNARSRGGKVEEREGDETRRDETLGAEAGRPRREKDT